MNTQSNILSNRKVKAWTITIIIHLLLLLIFLYVKYSTKTEYYDQVDLLEVQLGGDEDGFGDDPTMIAGDPAPLESSEKAHSQASENTASEQAIESSDEDVVNSVIVKKPIASEKPVKKDVKPTDNPNLKTSKDPVTTSNKSTSETPKTNKYVLDGASGNGGNGAIEDKEGTGRGNTTGSGTQGSFGDAVKGRMTTNLNLKGRHFVKTPSPNAQYNEGGRVEVKVWVNREGMIARHEIQSAANETLRKIVSQKIKDIQFNKSSSALPEQTGTIIFNFTTGSK